MRRSYFPPEDPANALLSMGYSLLSSWMLRSVLLHRLEPGWGYVHGIHSGMPSLVQDLIEPLRSTFIDPWALEQVASGLELSSFEETDFGWRIAEVAVRRGLVASFLAALERPLVGARVMNAPTAFKSINAMARETRAAINSRRVPTYLVERIS